MRRGPLIALAAALLFGISTPIAKLLLERMDAVLLASLLYLGSGLGLAAWRRIARIRRSGSEAPLSRKDLPWLAGSVLAGGVVAPVLLLVGLSRTPAATASLLLNLEGALTALIAWFIFRENFDRRIALGMVAILLGAALLSWSGRGDLKWGALLVAAACVGWAIDNNLTGRISAADPMQIAMIKGLVAGGANGVIALARGVSPPAASVVISAMLLGFGSYGMSLALFVRGLRLMGTARTSAYFSTAPFVGAILSLLLPGERPSGRLAVAGLLMGAGVSLHLSERHSHVHTHEPMEHAHAHRHDEHHRHAHSPSDPPGEPHSHPHRHEPITHDHPHYPDIHHRHHN
jgi:drug/metabolite transporter (DMT)-like permease